MFHGELRKKGHLLSLCEHRVSFPPGRAPVLTAAPRPTNLLLHPDRIQSPIGDSRTALKLCGVLTLFCSSGYCSQTWPDYELFDSCAPVFHFLAVAFPASMSEWSTQVSPPPPPPTGPCHGHSLSIGLKLWLSFNGSFTAAG